MVINASKGWLKRHQGTWRPGMPVMVSGLILAVYNFQQYIRGLDYVTGDRPDTTESLTVVEQAMPLPMWGAAFLMVAFIVTAGMVLRQARILITGCLLSVVLYAGLTWGLAMKMLARMRPPREFLDTLTDHSAHAPTHAGWIIMGLIFLATVALAFTATRKHRLWFIAAGILAEVVALIVATDGDTWYFLRNTAEHFPLDGWRTPTSFAMTTIIWALFAWGTKIMDKARRDRCRQAGHE